MGKKTILMVDAEKDSCFFVALNLEKSGKYRVRTAHIGKNAITEAVRSRPYLILLDAAPGLCQEGC